MKRFTFKKEERLCSKRSIDDLFSNGSSFVLYPFRVIFLPSAFESTSPAQVLISVPKRKFRKAIDRNLLKRRIREAYRLQKQDLLYDFLEQHSTKLVIGIQYIASDKMDSETLYRRLGEALIKLQHAYTRIYLGKDR